jgi:hypothetical protein
MKEHQKELVIIPLNDNGTLFTAEILYNNYKIGIFQLEKTVFPNINSGLGAPYNTQYNYTLIFNEKEHEKNTSLNIAMNSIETTGWFQLNGGILVNFNLGLPLGIYKNIGTSPEGIKYNLELINEENKAKIIFNRIC